MLAILAVTLTTARATNSTSITVKDSSFCSNLMTWAHNLVRETPEHVNGDGVVPPHSFFLDNRQRNATHQMLLTVDSVMKL